MLCVTKASFRCIFFPSFLVGMVVFASSTLLAQVVNEWVSWVTSYLFICSNQYCYCSSVSAYSGQCCSFNMRKRARLRFETEFHFVFKSHVMVLLVARICKQGKAELGEVSEVKWPKGLDTRQEAGVFVFTNRSGWPSHNQQTLAASCLCTLIYPLALQSDFFFLHKLQARILLKWWRRNWLSSYGFSIFVIQSSIEALFAFPSQNWSCLLPAYRQQKRSTGAW